MKERLPNIIGLSAISAVLFILHCNFIDAHMPRNKDLFIISGMDLNKYIPYVLGFGFAITATVILHYSKHIAKMRIAFLIAIAFFEYLAWHLNANTAINETVWVWLTSNHYGIYLGFIVFAYGMIKIARDNEQDDSNADDKIISISDTINEIAVNTPEKSTKRGRNANNYDRVIEMYQEGLTPSQIALKLGVAESTVYRNINKYKERDISSH